MNSGIYHCQFLFRVSSWTTLRRSWKNIQFQLFPYKYFEVSKPSS